MDDWTVLRCFFAYGEDRVRRMFSKITSHIVNVPIIGILVSVNNYWVIYPTTFFYREKKLHS